MDHDPVEPLASSLRGFVGLVEGVDEGGWDAATPCAGWTVRDLVNHVTGGNLLVGSLLGGAERPSAEEMAARRTADFLGADPIAALRSSSDGLVEAFRRPGALERPLVMPIGTVPGAAVAELRLTETITHGWDLAVATGQASPFDDDAIADALAFSERTLANLPPTSRAFGPPTTAPDGATPLARLVSQLGRDAAWSPPDRPASR